jgi:cyclic pyranopterin monophosphate synthase
MKKLSHFDAAGSPRMVDVSSKPVTRRTARAHAFVRMRPAVLRNLPENPKGNPLEIARIAGIAAAKKTADLIPLCHPLMLSHADVEVRVEKTGVRIIATAATTAQTGVEMEALTAAAVAALTVYDMTKALDKAIEIQDLYLLEKTGGKSGGYRKKGDKDAKEAGKWLAALGGTMPDFKLPPRRRSPAAPRRRPPG